MGGEGQQVDVLCPYVDGQMSRRLYCVGVKNDTPLPAHRADLQNRQDGADLVVGVHDGDQCSVLTNGFRYLLGGDSAQYSDWEQFHLESLAFQPFQRVQNGVMLKGSRDNVPLSFSCPQQSGGADGLVIRLTASRGESNLLGGCPDTGGDFLPGVLKGLLCSLPQAVQAGWITPGVLHTGGHGIDRSPAHFGGSRIVCVNHSNILSGVNVPAYPSHVQSANSGVDR